MNNTQTNRQIESRTEISKLINFTGRMDEMQIHKIEFWLECRF